MAPFCPQCGADNPAAARFCDQCGAALIPVPAQAGAPSAATVVPGTPVVTAQVPAAATASAGPNTCPQCGMSVIPGEAFCDNCGAPLLPQGTPSTAAPVFAPVAGVPQQPTYPAPQQVQPTPVAPVYTPPPTAAPVYTPPTPVAPAYTPPVAPAYTPPVNNRTTLAPSQLIVPSSGAIIALPAQAQVTVGRADAVSGFFPDVDLTPHGALDTGVGRRHLRLFVQGGQLLAEDLDSTNGSFLNDQKLQPRQPQPLKTGDELRLGKLLLQVQV